jgi:N-[(2S)-2-amino-2-carboxyethyl]-L-glutamate dehydrogenase
LNPGDQRSTISHISLRDLSPEVILSCENVVDDVDHVCRASTSVHLAEQLAGSRDFINCTLASLLLGESAARRNPDGVVVFSLFGLGILDLALSKFVCERAAGMGLGSVIPSFFPAPWLQAGDRES